MRQRLLLKSLFLLCALIGGVLGAWATDVTYKLTIDASDFNTTSYAANNKEKTSNAVCTTDNTKTYEVKWTSNQVMKSGNNMQWQKSNGYIYNSTALGTITNVTVTSSAGTFTTYYGTSAQPSSGTTVGGGYFKTKVGGATGTTSKIEVTFTISESGDNTPTPTHTATFSVNGATTTQDVEEGAAITFPADPTPIYGKVFMGWVTDAIDGTQTDAPSFVTSATMGKSDVTYYAVFADKEGTSEEVTKTYGFESETDNDWTIVGPVRTEGNANTGSYSGKINTNNTYVTFNSKVKVKEFSFAFKRTSANSNYSVYIETSSDNSTWNAADTYPMGDFANGSYTTKSKVFDGNSELYVRFHCYNTTAERYLDDITIKYTTGTVTYSNYCTTVVAPSVARPEITIAQNPFLFSTTATITCTTQGAAIKYSFDNKTWNNYSEALTINATTTIYAKAVLGNDESSVASVTATKNLAEPTVTVSGDLILDLNGENNVNAGTLTSTVTYNDAAVEGAAVTWSSSAPEVATIGETTGAVTLLTTGEVTFTATATFSATSDYAKATGTKTVTVVNSKQPGTVARPYTVAEAIQAIDDANKGTVYNVYVSGIVSQVDSYSNNSITYWISEDGTTTSQFEVYKGLNIEGEAAFSSKDDVQVGDEVTITGNITYYSNNQIYEFASGSHLVSLQRPEAPAAPTFSLEEDTYFTPQDVTLTTETEGATIYYSINNSAFSEYTCPITLDPGEYGNTKYTVKAYAKKGFRSSEEVSATYTINREKQIVVAPSTIDLGIEGGSGELAVTYINFPDHQSHTAGFHYWKYNGTNAWKNLDDNIPAWFHIEFSEDRSTLTYTIDENTTSEARDIEVNFWIQNTFSNRLYFTQEAKHFPIQVTPTLVEATAEGESGTIAVTYDENINNDDAAVVFCNAQGEAATYDWITAKINVTTKSLDYTIAANTGEARTAYLKVRAKDDQSIDAYSELITITQAEYVAPPVVATITVSPTSVEAPCEGASGTISVTYNNITNVAADVYFCDSEGEAATYDWITADINNENNVEYIIGANDGEARTAYMKVYAQDDNAEKVYSEIITITQAVLDYATLPFNYNGGRSNLPTGLTQEGLGSDYASAPLLKFDNTGDNLVLKINEAPGTLKFDIKGNGFSAGSTSTFKVQTSINGTDYTDLATYTELEDNKQTVTFDNLSADIRFIKWIYTEKGASRGGNVAIGNIKLEKYVAKYTLTYSQPEHGTISVDDENLNTIESGTKLVAETMLVIKAQPNEGYSFTGWTANAGTFDDNDATKPETTFTMPAEDVTLSATFTINSHLLTTLTENGILAITVDGVEQTMTSDGIIVNYGQTVNITATPADNYTFNNWESDDLDEFDTAANPLIFTMPDKNIGVIANFIDANKDYDITLNQPKSGATISAKVGGLNVETAKKDDKVVLSYDITGKKAFVSWTVLDNEDNEVTVTYDEQNDEYSFTMPASDVEVEAEFVDIYTVDFFVNGTKDSEATYAADAAIIFPEVTAPEGLTFMGWTESVISGTQNTAPAILVTEATMGTADKTYYAVYASRSDIPSAFSEYEKVTTNPGDWSGTYLLSATYNGAH